ncbi:MAG: PEP-CTERM sorting domain-containing protein [Aquabacterium sp.]
MKAAILASTLLALSTLPAQAALVERQYTASVSHVASSAETVVLGSNVINAGDKLTGTFVYDDAMLPESTSPFSTWSGLIYRGAIQGNHITMSLNGLSIVKAPAADASNCSFLDPLCTLLPVAIERSSSTTSAGVTDMLTLRYVPPVDPLALFVFNGPVRVASLAMTFSFSPALSGVALPTDVKLDDLRFALLTLNLSDGSGVFATIESISASSVPEPSAVAMFALGVFGVVMRQRHRTVSAPRD